MTSERIKEIQLETAYPNSQSVQQALLKVWNECEQAKQIEKKGNLLNNNKMEKKLKSLQEYNSQMSNLHWQFNSSEPRPNGIACPNCAEELVDSNPMMTLASFPPKKGVNCIKCDYVGYRIA